MEKSTLIAHVDSGKVLYAELGNYPAPEATGRWKPVPHLALVDALKNQINANYRIAREEYARFEQRLQTLRDNGSGNRSWFLE